MNLIQEIMENGKVVAGQDTYKCLVDNSNAYMMCFIKTITDKFGEYPKEDDEDFEAKKEEYNTLAEEYIKSQDGVDTFKANQLESLGRLTICALEGIASILQTEDDAYDLFHVLMSVCNISETEIGKDVVIKMLKKIINKA